MSAPFPDLLDFQPNQPPPGIPKHILDTMFRMSNQTGTPLECPICMEPIAEDQLLSLIHI